ncbi:cyclohex-1-ene-1-carboxylate:CoA ligase [Streptomyces sp. NRRL F-4489]|uniref:class I adenylate-forming enzyme family protein n=1 Tax=Streptomyces sp. NRRL F-4489 TaxID=1609095 RepID=UPI0007489770|nr:AMP-binding protein [Streptomyces sp. NRRL F-4489]KUL49002.1 cyclohex-1-ene-1-carboxylate:CoA ligase [Streptomyces sp. NRRL F-4489]
MSGSTLWDLVAWRAARTPDALALVQGAEDARDERRITFGGLRERAERVAAGLHAYGVRPGSTVVWQLPTRIETVLVSLALARLGAVQSPVLPGYREHELEQVLRRTGAAFLLVPGGPHGTGPAAPARRPAARLPAPPAVFAAYGPLPDGDPATLPPPPADADAVRWIYWTSGTTAAPRGVLHTDRGLRTAGGWLAAALRLGPGDVGSMAFPYAHVAGPDYTVMLLTLGIPAVLLERFALPGALAPYRRHGVTVAGGSTAFYSLFLAAQRALPAGERLLPSLRLLAGGGAPKPPALYHEVTAELGCQVVHGYALTEAPVVTMGDPLDGAALLANTDGRPPAGMEIRIAPGRDGGGGGDGSGEILVRGPAVCRGYLGEPDPFDRDGFLPTGDLGRLTSTGHLVVTGRLKDIIIRKGENVSAREIEDLLHGHPDIAGAAVIGLPDAERGELVCAVVEQPPGARELTLGAVTERLLAQGLARHKLPERLEVLPALPRGATLRKVLKRELRERFGGGGGAT